MAAENEKGIVRSLSGGRSYFFQYDREAGIEYRVFSDGTKEVVQTDNPSNKDAPKEEVDWDALAYKIAKKYDDKVATIRALPWFEWKMVKNLNFRWWKLWKLRKYLKMRKEILGYNDKMSRDELRFAEIDRCMALAY